MKKIEDGIVFSWDIKRILNGINSLDYNYNVKLNDDIISDLRDSFIKDTNNIFNGKVTIITEEEMFNINKLIGGEYPHCIFG